jgi:tRNA1(Val) A37 N6-methylase TrmN6
MGYDTDMPTKKQEKFTLLDGRIKMAQSLYNPTSDAVWLAAFAPNNDNIKTVLDVGIGTGGVSLCLLHNHPDMQITGIDISEEMLTACKKNMTLNKKTVNLINADITKWSTPDVFDLVITNPPYFEGTPAKHGAHHNADIAAWIKRCVARAKPNGYFCTIVDTLLLDTVLAILHDKHLGDVEVFPLFGAKYSAERVLIRAKKCVKTGATLFRGSPMNDDAVLRSGLTIDTLLATL